MGQATVDDEQADGPYPVHHGCRRVGPQIHKLVKT